MRISTIVVSLLLASGSPALSCDKFETGPEGWLSRMPIARRAFAEAGEEESAMSGARIVGVGLAALALVAVTFRAFGRASGRARPVEFEPAGAGEPPWPTRPPGDAWLRVDPGHVEPGPGPSVEDEEALSGALAMHSPLEAGHAVAGGA
jgi:hypothetical protein